MRKKQVWGQRITQRKENWKDNIFKIKAEYNIEVVTDKARSSITTTPSTEEEKAQLKDEGEVI